MEKTVGEPARTKREMLLERMRNKYPDKEFNDDEAIYGQIADDYDDYDKQIESYKGNEKSLTDMFMSDPRSAAFLAEWHNGSDPVIALVKQFGTDIKDAIDDPARIEEIAAANKEYLERVAKEKKLEEEYQSNLAQSLSMLDELQKENGLSDEQVDKAMALLLGIVSDGIMGKFTPENVNMAMKAITHDEDVAIANETGEVRGRNAKIDERLRKAQGDGLARLGGKNNAGGGRAKSIFDFARLAR